jgi:cytochrome c
MRVRRVVPRRFARRAAIIAIAGCAAGIGACIGNRSTPATKVDGGDVARGARAISTYGCGSCHMISGIRDAQGMVGPPLTAFGRRTILAGRVPNTPGSLEQWIRTPQEIDPGTAMPDLGVTEPDARDIAAYLLSLR